MLAYQVLRFVEAAKRNPASASDATLLDRLEREAREDFAGHYVAQYAPIADVTREALALLPANSGPPTNTLGVSNLAELIFPWPAEILGFYVSVRPFVAEMQSGVPLGALPTTDDVLTRINVDDETNLAARTSTSDNQGDQAFVTLTAYSILSPRILCIKLNSPQPRITIEHRWKTDPTAPTPANQYPSCIVGVAAFARRLSGSKSLQRTDY
jgi:hypothetical protein